MAKKSFQMATVGQLYRHTNQSRNPATSAAVAVVQFAESSFPG